MPIPIPPVTGARNSMSRSNAAEFDIEAAYSFVKTAMAGSKLERPGEVALAVDLGRTSFAGVTATSAKAILRYDASGIRIERLAVGDFGGAAVSASGQIDIASAQPAGNISLNLTAPKIDGVAAALERILPGSGETLLRHAARLSPARIDASLSLDPPTAGSVVRRTSRQPESSRSMAGSATIRLSAVGSGDRRHCWNRRKPMCVSMPVSDPRTAR